MVPRPNSADGEHLTSSAKEEILYDYKGAEQAGRKIVALAGTQDLTVRQKPAFMK